MCAVVPSVLCFHSVPLLFSTTAGQTATKGDNELRYGTSLIRCGLHREEFEKVVSTKIGGLYQFCDPELATRCTSLQESVQALKQMMALRPTIGDPHQLDQRCTSSIVFALNAITTDQKSAPQKTEKETSRIQGVTKCHTEVWKSYHGDQLKLFQELNRQRRTPPSISCSVESLLLRDEGATRAELSTSAFCDTLDEFTLAYLRLLNYPGSFGRRQDLVDLWKVFYLCIQILMRRLFVTFAVENDLLNTDGHKQWKEHVWIIASFGALVVCLDMISKKFSRCSFIKYFL